MSTTIVETDVRVTAVHMEGLVRDVTFCLFVRNTTLSNIYSKQ